MIIDNEIRKTVAFLGYKTTGNEYKFAGSIFFVGSPGSPFYAVTAKHVIQKIKNLGLDDSWIRINSKSHGAVWLRCPLSNWINHPRNDVDVAIFPCQLVDDFDHMVIPFSLFITEEIIDNHEIGVGDEVFVTGLFKHHCGERRNIPIVRIGNLAALNEEKILTKDCGLIDAYLIEARSIGGLSGSPVFLNLGITRFIKGQFKQATTRQICFLLGLIYGHYDVNENCIDNSSEDSLNLSSARINMGIAIVTPIQKVSELIELNRPKAQPIISST